MIFLPKTCPTSEIGVPTIVFGQSDVEIAYKLNKYVSLDQLNISKIFIKTLCYWLAKRPLMILEV